MDAAFAEIVASLEREGLGAALLDEQDRTLDLTELPDEPPAAEAVSPDPEPPTGWRTSSVEWDSVPVDEGHYEPPEPPPLPRPRLSTVFGVLLLAIGILLLVAPGLIGLAPRIGTPLALISLATGIGWLILRMRQGPPPDADDNGAQL